MTATNCVQIFSPRWFQVWSPLKRGVAVSVDSHLANIPSIIVSCIVLHNICKTHGGHCLDKWTVEEGSHNSGGGTAAIATTPDCTTATARDTIRDELQ